ncbi:hypothetical protein J3R83DRAFT_9855 [Lanmaoa asiatica]|nr:hypothetical protein J3R83DRAFT_9855 [Lanmaoa asiatica]
MFGLLATLALAATASKPSPPNCTRSGTVILGDTCSNISARHNVSTYQLALVNAGIINLTCTNLYPGEVRHPPQCSFAYQDLTLNPIQ